MENTSEQWTESLWREAMADWGNRQQDTNYRDYVVRPAMKDAVRNADPKDGQIFLDFGCGEGRETAFLRDAIAENGVQTGHLYGYDKNREAISRAGGLKTGHIMTSFHSGDFWKFAESNALSRNVDILISSFVLQETPYLDETFKMMNYALRANGIGIHVFVHPQFEEALRKKGELRVEPTLASDQWDFAAAYPIVEKGRKPFYLPCFHRSLSRYLAAFEMKYYIEEVRGLKPSAEVLALAEKEKRSPFYAHEHNVYWPEISEISSSVIVTVRKK